MHDFRAMRDNPYKSPQVRPMAESAARPPPQAEVDCGNYAWRPRMDVLFRREK